MKRREALGHLGGLIGLGMLGGMRSGTAATETLISSSAAAAGVAGKPLTIAHITDIHITDGRHAEKWFAKCLHDIQSHGSKPSLVLNTGDCVMDSLKQERSKADQLWSLWQGVLKGDNSLPIHHCLGNHDHWGLGLKDNAAVKSDPHFGKKLGTENLGLERPYYSFDHGDWHFIALDSVFPDGSKSRGWISKLDDEQFEWLKQDLKATPTNRPVLVYSHIPILQVASYKYLKPNDDGVFEMGFHRMLTDARRVIDLFKKHPNVKLCLSGHLHLEDHVELSGVTYICDGSVCGEWWKGNHFDSSPGYSLLTLNPDGTFDRKYESYGWSSETPA